MNSLGSLDKVKIVDHDPLISIRARQFVNYKRRLLLIWLIGFDKNYRKIKKINIIVIYLANRELINLIRFIYLIISY